MIRDNKRKSMNNKVLILRSPLLLWQLFVGLWPVPAVVPTCFDIKTQTLVQSITYLHNLCLGFKIKEAV